MGDASPLVHVGLVETEILPFTRTMSLRALMQLVFSLPWDKDIHYRKMAQPCGESVTTARAAIPGEGSEG